MKDLIIPALELALSETLKTVPQTKTKVEMLSVIDVNPLGIQEFMTQNNIPNDAYFGGRENGYDAWDDICICWDTQIPTTDREKNKHINQAFTNKAFLLIQKTLLKNGYKRVSFDSGLLKEFHDTTVYQMFANKNYDRLVKYYSLSFKLI